MTKNSSAVTTGRRGLMLRGLGIGAAAGLAGTALVATGPARAATITEADVLNFALNLEYLEAEYYLRAVYGRGLDSADAGSGAGPVTGGRQVRFGARYQREIAREIAHDELNHVKLLRSVLGKSAVARPAIDLSGSFAALGRATNVPGGSIMFDPFVSEENFWLGGFTFEDVGVAAYKGATPALKASPYLEAAAGILAVEAYHAGEIRSMLLRAGKGFLASRIARGRDMIDGASVTDQGLSNQGMVNIVPSDLSSVAFSRTPRQVLDVVYLATNATRGGFFPRGLNGTIS